MVLRIWRGKGVITSATVLGLWLGIELELRALNP